MLPSKMTPSWRSRLLYRALARVLSPTDRASTRAVLLAATRAGWMPRLVGESLKAILELPDLRLHQIMVPRVDVVGVFENCAAQEAARHMAESGHTRVPVFRDTADLPVGILHALDLMRELAPPTASGGIQSTAGKLARPALSLSRTLSVPDAVQAMRSEAAHIALVIDEHGAFAGLVTFQDLLEQIVGPLPDEIATEGRDAIRRLDDGSAVVGPAARLHEIERELGVRFPRSRFASIGGLVYDHLRRVPKPGDVVQLPGARIEVISVDGQRLRDLRIQVVPAAARRGNLVEVGIGREVVCGADVIGRVERLIGDAGSAHVNHVVIRSNHRAAVVPLDLIERSDEDVAYLRPEACNLQAYPEYAPQGVALGTQVTCSDGPVGKVQRVVLDQQTGAMTHIVVRESSTPLVQRDIVIPLSWAYSITPERIELAANRDDLLELPEARSDDAISIDLLQRLNEDPRFQGVDRYTQKIEVYGGLVRLSGRVRTTELKQAAEDLARATPGVLSVDNQLIADDDIVAGVEHALRRRGIDIQDLEVAALLGEVTLRGQAATEDVIATAVDLARGVPGVRAVVNELRVAA